MALEILYGSGSSKRTEVLYEKILSEARSHPEKNYVLLVPEQASLSVQEDLVRCSAEHGLLNIDVLTFHRLAYRVFHALNEPEKNVLDDMGKLMLLRLVLGRHEDELGVLRRNLRREGFLEEMKSVIAELAQYNVSPEELEKRAKELDAYPVLRNKLRDISLVYREFLQLIHQDYEMKEERMTRLARILPDWGDLSRTVFALEGFTGFTPPQYEVLRVILSASPALILSVTLGSGQEIRDHQPEDALFRMSARMAEEMKQRAVVLGLEIRETRVTEDRQISAPLRFLERQLFVYPKVKYPEETDGIRILRAKDRKEEVLFLRSEILKGIREGLDYRDMAVICGDPEAYREELEARLAEQKIPYFIDARRSLSGDPLVLLLSGILNISASGFELEAVVNVMKNPLMEEYLGRQTGEGEFTPYERICQAENYALARGLRGKSAWEGAFDRKTRQIPEKRLPEIRETCRILLQPVIALTEVLEDPKTPVSERLKALVDFLETIGAWETLKKQAGLFSAEEERLRQREYDRIYELLMDLLDGMNDILGDKTLSGEEFSDVLLAGLRELKIGMVPPTKDRLVVGDLKRTRLSHIRRLFILGANEGIFPPQGGEGGLLSEADRELLASMDLSLAPTEKAENFNSRFYLYLLLTKPSETLTVSYLLNGDDGRALTPCYLIGLLREMFGCPFETPGARPVELVTGISGGLETLAEELRLVREGEQQMTPDKAALYRSISEEPEGLSAMEKILRAVFYRYKEEKLSREAAKALFGEKITGSVSRLESFAGCPFAHFASYGLNLQEREEFTVDAADMGTFLHDSICEFFLLLRKYGEDWRSLSEDRRAELVQESVRSVSEQGRNDMFRDTARSTYLLRRAERVTARTLWALTRQWNAGDYEETESEIAFNGQTDPDTFRIPLGGGRALELLGRIDRMDAAEKDGSIYVKVIDYKSSGKNTDYTKIYYGLQLQLLIYMKAAEALARRKHPGKNVIPAGIYYYHMTDPMVPQEEEGDPEEQIYKELRLQGITAASEAALELLEKEMPEDSRVVRGLRKKKDGSFYAGAAVADREQLEKLENYALKKAGELASEILEGSVPVTPCELPGGTSTCSWCGFRGLCGFDPRIPGYRRKKLDKKTLEDLTEESREGSTSEEQPEEPREEVATENRPEGPRVEHPENFQQRKVTEIGAEKSRPENTSEDKADGVD